MTQSSQLAPTADGGRAPASATPTTATQDRQSLHTRLLVGAAQLGVRLDAATLARLDTYLALLQQWGRKINLTAIPLDDVERIATLHFLDSLACVAQIPPLASLPQPTLIDVGSGAGFPGVLCALIRPELRVTLVERVGKKAAFLLTLRRELGVQYDVESCDAERLIPARAAEGFGVAVSRAALPPPRWLELGSRLVAPSGYVLAMVSEGEPVPHADGCDFLGQQSYELGVGVRHILSWQRRIAR